MVSYPSIEMQEFHSASSNHTQSSHRSMGLQSSHTEQKKPSLPIVLREPSSWKTDFNPQFELYLTFLPKTFKKRDLSPRSKYEKLKDFFIKEFQNIARIHPEFTPEIRFNNAKQCVEIGHSYSGFYNLLPENGVLYSLLPKLEYGPYTPCREDYAFPIQVSPARTGEERILYSDTKGIIGYDLDHPEFEQAVQISQNSALQKNQKVFLNLGTSRAKLLSNLAEKTRFNHTPFRVILGEIHTDDTARKMLITAMPFLKNLVLEHFYHETHGRLFKQWAQASEATPMPLELESHASHLDYVFNFKDQEDWVGYKDVLLAAKKHGLCLIPIDTEALHKAYPYDPTGAGIEERITGMNYAAQQIIANTIGPNDDFIALVGSAHSSDFTLGDKTFLGLDRLCNAQSISVVGRSSGSEVMWDEPYSFDPQKTIMPDILVARGQTTDTASPEEIAPPQETQTSLPNPDSQNIHSAKGSTISGAMVSLGAVQTVASFQKGDTLNGVVGASGTAIGVMGLASSAAEKSKMLLKAAPSVGKIAEQFSKIIPYAGSVLSAVNTGQDIKRVYDSVQSHDVKNIIEGSVDGALDGAMAVTDLIPVVGTPITAALLTARLTSDLCIDQAWDPEAYKKTLEVISQPQSSWTEKALAAATGAAQALWKYTLVGQAFSAFGERKNLKDLVQKQKTEREQIRSGYNDVTNFVKITDIPEENVRVLDFTAGVLSPHGGSLEVHVESSTKIRVHVGGTANPQSAQELELGTLKPATLFINMSQGATYTYSTEVRKAKYYVIPIDSEEIVTSTTVQHDSLTSRYWAPQDGTPCVFIAPSHEPSSSADSVLPTSSVHAHDFHYDMYGGSGKTTYVLSTQNATIHCGSGQNNVQVSFKEDVPRTFVIEDFRDDGSCSLILENMTVDSALFQQARINIHSSQQGSDVKLNFGKTCFNLLLTHAKSLMIQTDDALFLVETSSLIKKSASSNPESTSYEDNFKECISSSIIGYKNLKKQEKSNVKPHSTFLGTSGRDTFIIDAKGGKSMISQFSKDQDQLLITNNKEHIDLLSKAIQKNDDVFIPFDDENTLTLKEVQLSNLRADDISSL